MKAAVFEQTSDSDFKKKNPGPKFSIIIKLLSFLTKNMSVYVFGSSVVLVSSADSHMMKTRREQLHTLTDLCGFQLMSMGHLVISFESEHLIFQIEYSLCVWYEV